MSNKAKLLSVSEKIEGEICLEIEGRELICFCFPPPFQYKLGTELYVEFDFLDIADFGIRSSQEGVKSIEQIGDGFVYRIRGFQDIDRLDAGILFNNPLPEEFEKFRNSFIEMVVTRIDADIVLYP